MKLEDLLDMENLLRRVGEGMIRERQHPDHPTLRLLSYSEAAQWSRTWDNETTTCRGLIYEAGSGEVLARPYPKFFNHSEYGQQHLAGVELDLAAPAEVSDKMDGSLGIFYRNPFTGEWAVATRGSFDSDQARWANDQLDRYLNPADGHFWEPADGMTYLTEIIYPENRIVCDYGGTRELSLLGAVHIESGRVEGPRFDPAWPGMRAETFEAGTLGEALAMEPRKGAEGLVVRYLDTGRMVKIKQEDYVRLHKIITGLSDKAVWEHLASGQKIMAMLESVPDEFHEWVLDMAEGFVKRMAQIKAKAGKDFNQIVSEAGTRDRRAFAELAKKNERPHLMFQLLDGRDIDPAVWKELKPFGVRYMSEAACEEAMA